MPFLIQKYVRFSLINLIIYVIIDIGDDLNVRLYKRNCYIY
mgnify:FL=1